MTFVVIKYNRSKKLSIDFPGKGRFVLKNFQEYSSNDYEILRDRKVVKELIDIYHCSIVEGRVASSPKNKKIDKKKKPVVPSNIVLEAPKDMTIVGQSAKSILVSYEGQEYLSAIQIVMQSHPDKEFILACYDKHWDLIRAKNIKVIHPMKIGQFQEEVDECFDLDELISYLDKNEFDILDSINQLLGLKPLKSYDFSYEIKAEEKEHSEIQARKLKNKKRKILFHYPDDNDQFDHEKICDIIRFLTQESWTVSVIGNSDSESLPKNRLIYDFRKKFKEHEICALAENFDAFILFNNNSIFNILVNKNINKQHVFLLNNSNYTQPFLKHFKNVSFFNLENKKSTKSKSTSAIDVATKFKNDYQKINKEK